jgi:hypothetical protein
MTNKSLVDKLLEASQKIQKSSTRGSGNYILTSPVIADFINKYKSEFRKEKIKRLFNE